MGTIGWLGDSPSTSTRSRVKRLAGTQVLLPTGNPSGIAQVVQPQTSVKTSDDKSSPLHYQTIFPRMNNKTQSNQRSTGSNGNKKCSKDHSKATSNVRPSNVFQKTPHRDSRGRSKRSQQLLLEDVDTLLLDFPESPSTTAHQNSIKVAGSSRTPRSTTSRIPSTRGNNNKYSKSPVTPGPGFNNLKGNTGSSTGIITGNAATTPGTSRRGGMKRGGSTSHNSPYSKKSPRVAFKLDQEECGDKAKVSASLQQLNATFSDDDDVFGNEEFLAATQVIEAKVQEEIVNSPTYFQRDPLSQRQTNRTSFSRQRTSTPKVPNRASQPLSCRTNGAQGHNQPPAKPSSIAHFKKNSQPNNRGNNGQSVATVQRGPVYKAAGPAASRQSKEYAKPTDSRKANTPVAPRNQRIGSTEASTKRLPSDHKTSMVPFSPKTPVGRLRMAALGRRHFRGSPSPKGEAATLQDSDSSMDSFMANMSMPDDI